MNLNATELRIGNYFNVPSPAQSPFRIDCIDLLYPADNFGKFGMFVKGFENAHPLTWYLNDLEPIPLTEELLSSFGFNDDSIYWEKQRFPDNRNGVFALDSEHRLHVTDSTGYGIIIAREVKYVHQLQNLYFALTGKELTLEAEPSKP